MSEPNRRAEPRLEHHGRGGHDAWMPPDSVRLQVDEPLSARDFEALGITTDAWIESHGKLNGLVIQARTFPGWENLRGLTQHLRFVKNHREKIGRVALATDSKLASVAPNLARPFVDAEVKRFDYDDVEAATEWAGAASSGTGATPN